MKILFINTNDIRGGAAIAAMRLHEGLNRYCNTENFFIVANRNSNQENIFACRNYFQRKTESLIEILSSKIGLQYQFSPFSTYNIIKFAKTLQPDIISLHNTQGGYFATKNLKALSKIAPIVWTLHDMWSFTGNSSHTFGDESWKSMKNSPHLINISPSIGINTGQYLLKQKRNIYQHSDLTIVTPSFWLHGLAKQSPVFAHAEIKQINNGINLNKFRKLDKIKTRKKLKIHPSSKILMFVAETISKTNPWKGGSDLLKILKGINEKLTSKIELLIIGEGNLPLGDLQNFKIHQVGYVADENLMVEYFNAADIFIYPTKADNLPNVLLEATACGTPAVCNDVGGCKEIIINGFNGYVVNSDEETFIDRTLDLLFKQDLDIFSANSLSQAKKFDLNSIAKQYHDLFKEIKSKHL